MNFKTLCLSSQANIRGWLVRRKWLANPQSVVDATKASLEVGLGGSGCGSGLMAGSGVVCSGFTHALPGRILVRD